MDWHAYINETPYEAFVNSADYQRYRNLCDASQKIYALYFGDLRYKNVPKQIICEPTQPVATRMGHPPFCFRFQCLITGRKSKFIKECEYHLFGITKKDCKAGLVGARIEVVDKFAEIKVQINEQIRLLSESAFKSDRSRVWWVRYNEYLSSEDWFNLRAKVIARDSGKCAVSYSEKNLQVHHFTYRRVGCEHLSDLITLSQPIHESFHNPACSDHLQVKNKVDSLRASFGHVQYS
jgi:5-methylcytosine-specific restriction endonuclease McrA